LVVCDGPEEADHVAPGTGKATPSIGGAMTQSWCKFCGGKLEWIHTSGEPFKKRLATVVCARCDKIAKK